MKAPLTLRRCSCLPQVMQTGPKGHLSSQRHAAPHLFLKSVSASHPAPSLPAPPSSQPPCTARLLSLWGQGHRHLGSLCPSPGAGTALPCLSCAVLQSGADYGFLVSQNTKLLSALEDLRHRCSSLAEENSLLVSRGRSLVLYCGRVRGWQGRESRPGRAAACCQVQKMLAQGISWAGLGGKGAWAFWVPWVPSHGTYHLA